MSADVSLEHPLKPQVQHVVEKDVRQHGTEGTALRRALFGADQATGFHVPGLQEPPDQQQQTAIANPHAQELHHPVVTDLIEEALNVRFDHETDRTELDRIVDRPQRLMGAASRPKAVRTIAEVSLVDRLQDAGNSLLDDLVLDRRQAQRTCLRIVLRDVHPFDRQRFVPLGLEAFHQIDQVGVQVLAVRMPARLVDTTSLLLAEGLIAPPQERRVQQMS